MEALDIALPQMTVLYGVVLPPWLLLGLIGLGLSRAIAIGILRMSLQLALVGVYLKTLFTLNNPWLNGLWVLVMLVVADWAILKRAGLKRRYFFAATLAAVTASILFSTAYLLLLVVRPPLYYDAHYLVPLAGMILANMATLGLVSLPGMMTGQILGGGEPWLAVKYQIAIMLCIFASTTLASILNLALSVNRAFNQFDVLKDDIIARG